MPSPRRHDLARVCIGLGLLLGCGDDAAPPPGTGMGGDPAHRDASSGGTDGRPESPRPDGGAILPEAEDEVALEFGGEPVRWPIAIDAEPGVLDVQLSIDTSGSIDSEIDALQQDLGTIRNTLRARVPSVSFGVSRFEDFPESPWGKAPLDDVAHHLGDTPFTLLSPITSDENRVANAVVSLDQPLGEGGDIPESGAEALWQIATGEGYMTRGRTFIEPYDGRAAPGGGTAGGVGFRDGALRVVLHVTDAAAHDPEDYVNRFPGTHDMQDAALALADIGARLVAIVSGACGEAESSDDCDAVPHAQARSELEQAALVTGAVTAATRGSCPFGLNGADLPAVDDQCPLVFDVSPEGEGLATTISDAIVALVDGVRFNEVTGQASDDPLRFVQRVIPIRAEVPGARSDVEAAQIADLLPEDEPDGEPDGFVQVHAKARLHFEVELRNTRIAPSDVDQHFRVAVAIMGDGLTLEEHFLRVRIPAGGRLAPELPDAGGADAASAADDDAGR
jgi:hypothetical protein